MITLSTEQFDSLLRAALSTSHLWEACLVLLGVTCGWGFQALENKRRNNQTRTENLHNIIAQYNAAFAKFTTIATSVAINGNDLILKNFLKEKKQWEKLISKEAYAHDIIDFGALTTFPCLDERPLLEIMQPSLATLYSPFLNQVLQTLLNDTYRYNQILDFRNTMIKESEIHSTKTWDEKDIPNLLSKYEAIHDATLKVLFLAETLIDHTLWVQARLNKEIYDLKFRRQQEFGNEWVNPDTGQVE